MTLTARVREVLFDGSQLCAGRGAGSETAVGDLSAHFSKSEFACHCCGEMKIQSGLIEALEQLRALAGREIAVHDGYRCPSHNQEVGGVSDSEHTFGIAADIAIAGLSLQEMYELALQVPAFCAGGSEFMTEAFCILTTGSIRRAGRGCAANM